MIVSDFSLHFLVFVFSYVQTLQLKTILKSHEESKYTWFEDPRQDKAEVEHEANTLCRDFEATVPFIFQDESCVKKCISQAMDIVDVELNSVVYKTE